MNLFDLARTRVTLRSKINLLVSLDILLVLALVMVVFGYIIIKVEFDDKGQRALTEAIMVANMPQIIDAFQLADPSVAIQPIAEGIRKETGASFVVVGNMNLIRYSHPNPWQIGKVMVGNDDYQVLHGHTSITEAVGTLGLSPRPGRSYSSQRPGGGPDRRTGRHHQGGLPHTSHPSPQRGGDPVYKNRAGKPTGLPVG